MGSPTDLRPIPFWSPAEIDATIPRAIAHVQGGGLLAYPTETIYGFGGAIDTDAVSVLVGLKNRPLGKPFLLLVSSSAMIGRLGLHMTNASSMLAARFWPGPLTLVLRGAEKRVPVDVAPGPAAAHRVAGGSAHLHQRQPATAASGAFGERSHRQLPAAGRIGDADGAGWRPARAVGAVHRGGLHGAASARHSPRRARRRGTARRRSGPGG